jgi:hypothetical protein
VHEAHGQDFASGGRQIKIDDGVARRARIGLDRADKRHAVSGDDLAQAGGAGREARQVDAQPFGKRGVDIGDTAVLVGGEEAGGRMVEMVDRLLQVEEEPLLFGALLRNVGQLPGKQRKALARHLEAAGPHPVPARARLRARPDGLGKAELAVTGLAVAQAGRQAVDRRRSLLYIRKQALDRFQIGRGGGPGHVRIGAVGVDHPALGVGDKQALRHRIDEGL